MVASGWGIRLFEANEYEDEFTIDFFDNFKKGKNRQLDSVIAFSGIYGIDNYLIWNIHKDLPNYDFSTVALDVSIFMYKSTDVVCFQDFYRVQDIRYNTSKSQYTLYAISETTIRLHSKLAGWGVTSLSYKEDRTAKDVIEDVIQGNDIFYVLFHEDNDATKTMLHYEYRYFDIDPEWTVLDFIEYICDDNKYEWFIDTLVDKETNIPTYILHFGHELMRDADMEASKPLGIEIDNVSESLYSMKITTNGSPMQPMANWEDTHKCVWAKHTAGKGGGISKGCFVPVGLGHLDKHLYLRTLEGNIEKTLGSSMINRRRVRIPSIGIGNILTDEGFLKDDEGKSYASPYIDSISIQKRIDSYVIREPHNIIIDRGEERAVQHQLERASRWSPYMDNRAGLLFPSPTLTKEDEDGLSEVHPPNSLIFYVDGKRESAVMGGYVYGGGAGDWAEYDIPKKNRDDFRFKLPNKGEIYYDAFYGRWHITGDGGVILKNQNVDFDELPALGLQPSEFDEDKIRLALYNGGCQIEGNIPRFILEPGGCFGVAPNTDALGMGPGMYEIRGYNDIGQINVYAHNKIKIKTEKASAELIIETGDGVGGLEIGTITINTTGSINMGNDATSVKLAGGGKKVSHGTHTHTIPVAIPGPPQTTNPTTDNSTKTEVD